MDDLTLHDLLKCQDIVNDFTQIVIWDATGNPVAVGTWFEDRVLAQAEKPIGSIRYWVDSNRLHIDLR
nr:MAG TPA: hypothetical protein [Caudoviricetes sp.]